jgi:hypothetical protein
MWRLSAGQGPTRPCDLAGFLATLAADGGSPPVDKN